MTRQYYAAAWTASAPVAIEECVRVHCFSSKRERDAYVLDMGPGTFYHNGFDRCRGRGQREALTRCEAGQLLRTVYMSAYGQADSTARLLQECREDTGHRS